MIAKVFMRLTKVLSELSATSIIISAGGPVGPSVARSAANPWALGLEIGRVDSPAGVGRTAARVSPKLVPCKSLSECCAGPK